MINTPKLKTTEELVQALRREREDLIAGRKGIPVNLNPEIVRMVEKKFDVNPALGAEGLLQIAYYQDFREQVQKYQVENNISGLITKTVQLDGKTIKFPYPESQLIITPDDLDVLKAAKSLVFEFFMDYVRQPMVHVSYTIEAKDGSEWDVETTPEFLSYFASQMEWATLDDCSSLLEWGEVSLQIGRGDPNKAPYADERDSDCWFFYAGDRCKCHLA